MSQHYTVKKNADGDLWGVGKDLLGNITVRLKTANEDPITIALPPSVASQVALAILDITTRSESTKNK